MILVFGALADSVTAYICTRLSTMAIDFLLLDWRQYARAFDLHWSIENGIMLGTIHYGSKELPLSRVHSVYVHQLDSGYLSPQTGSDGYNHSSARHENSFSLAAFVHTIPVLVVNRPDAAISNCSKPYQQQIIARYGFKVPRTLITTVPGEARRFYEVFDGRVIYKSISHQRSIVKRMTPADLERLEQVRACPTQFQEYIPGVDIRVHTVGSRVFATEITTDAVDYRYSRLEGAHRSFRPVELPVSVAERCLRLANGLDMVVSGIDLRRNPEGEYYCFEVNPTPGFTFYQSYTGQRIGDAIIDLLCRGSK